MTSRQFLHHLLGLPLFALCVTASACAGPSPTSPTPQPGTPPATALGEWQATAVRDVPLPATIHVFADDVVDGRPASTHLIVDAATLTLQADGRYIHTVRYSEWSGTPGGPPDTLRVRFTHHDFGEWTHSALSIRTLSGWLQNHAMTGELGTGGDVLRMQHGLSHGDTPVAFRYVRTGEIATQ